MARIKATDEQLRAQIETTSARDYPLEPIEDRIAAGLGNHGHFDEAVTSEELAVILRNLVYMMFADHKVAGMGVGIIHNIAKMGVRIWDSQASVAFIVHIHKPIVAFLRFQYTLVNDPRDEERLRVKPGTLQIEQNTRRFDLKAKAALTAINVENIARQEMSDLNGIIGKTLPPQLERRGIFGTLSRVALSLNGERLNVLLQGEFNSNSRQAAARR